MISTRNPILQYYYDDLVHYPRPTKTEIAAIVASVPVSEVRASPPTPRARVAQQRLVEAHLGLAVHTAITLCPSPLRADLLPDLIQEANLALVYGVGRCPWDTESHDITGYLLTCMENQIRRSLDAHYLIKPAYCAKERAKAEGTVDAFYAALKTISLDAPLSDERESTLYDVLASPESGEEPLDEGKREQVDQLLSYLPERAETVVRLRYGLLSPDDARPRTYLEIAAMLHISRNGVNGILRHAMKHLQALVQGRATLAKRGGKLCIWMGKARGGHVTLAGMQETEHRALVGV